MIRYRGTAVFFSILFFLMTGCKPVKQINKAIAPKDTSNTVIIDQSKLDSVMMIKKTVENLNRNYIDFKTFNAKIKVQYQDSRGKNQDLTAIVRIMKDSAIWISLTASLLNVEVYRILIKKRQCYTFK